VLRDIDRRVNELDQYPVQESQLQTPNRANYVTNAQHGQEDFVSISMNTERHKFESNLTSKLDRTDREDLTSKRVTGPEEGGGSSSEEGIEEETKNEDISFIVAAKGHRKSGD